MKKQNFFVLFLFIFFLLDVTAQSPDSFKYQAVIRDASTNTILANQQISILIKLRRSTLDGPVVYEEVFVPTTNTFGLVNLQIGNGNSNESVFADIDWSDGPYFIETAIDQTGGSNHITMGVSQLLSVPYALYAGNGSKWNNSTFNSNFLQYDHSVIVGKDINSESPFMVNNSTNFIGPSTNTVIAQFRTEYQGSGASFIVYGYPDTDLVLPHMKKSVMLYATEDADDMILCATKPQGTIRFFTQAWSDPKSERMRIDPNGNVGIGTTNPASKLQIEDGDIYIEDINKGVIMKSANGLCWRMTIDNSGGIVTNQIICP